MTDYTELVKALRSCAENFGCPIECPRYSPADEGVRACVSRLEKDAADAIEELQQIADHHEQAAKDYWKEACEYKAQLPKRGKWVEENRRPRSSQFVCSECHRTAYDPQPTRDKAWRKRCRYAYCPNCGADMRKMEVQE